MQAFIKPLFLAILTLLSSSIIVEACSCTSYPSPCEAFRQAKVVFVGKAISFTDAPVEEETLGGKYTYQVRTFRFLVEEQLKGPKKLELNVYTGRIDSSCHVNFEVGQSYLIYATSYTKGELSVGGCNRFGSLPWARGEIQLLRSLISGTPENNVYGSVQRVAYDFKDNRSASVIGPMADIRIVMDGNDSRFETVTDTEGHYKITDVPKGKYRITALLQTPFSPSSQEIEIKKDGCGTQADFGAQLNGQIKGMVLDAQGHPVTQARLMLMPFDKASEDESSKSIMWYGTNENGQYGYDHLPPGRYILAASVEGPPVAKIPYGRVYYPNALKLENAGVITVGESERLEGRNIQIPWLNVRKIEGSIMWSDGSPVTNGWISLFKSVNSPDGPDERYAEVNANKQGRFTLQVIEGATYWVRAYGYTQDGKYKRINAQSMRLDSSNFDQPLVVVVPVPKSN